MSTATGVASALLPAEVIAVVLRRAAILRMSTCLAAWLPGRRLPACMLRLRCLPGRVILAVVIAGFPPVLAVFLPLLAPVTAACVIRLSGVLVLSMFAAILAHILTALPHILA